MALGILFGVVVGKEVFGGTGMNILNPALTARAFLFFAYPGQISGDKVWTAAQTSPDGFSGATWLARAATDGTPALEGGLAWRDAFLGLVPGSMGETSALACLIGAVILVATGIGSWRIMAGVVVGIVRSDSAPERGRLGHQPAARGALPLAHRARRLGLRGRLHGHRPGHRFAHRPGRWIYGLLIGVLAIFIRVLNPAYPEGMMLAILFMNVFAATIDHFVVRANIRRREARYAA